MNFDESFDSAPCGLAQLAPDGVFLRANRVFCDWTGFSASELIGQKSLADLIEGDGRLFFSELSQALRSQALLSQALLSQALLSQPLAGDKSAMDEVFAVLRHKSGALLPAYFNFARQAGVQDRIDLAAFRGENRASYEAELRRGKQAAERLAAIVANSLDAIVSVDPAGAVLTANRAFCDIFHYELAELAGAKLDALIVPEEYLPQYADKLRRAASGPIKPQIVRRRRKDGHRLDFSLSTAPIRDETGQVVAISAIYRDVEPLMRAAEHIEFLLREVNHRSNNMLAVVQAVARQTARLAATPDLFIESFMARLAAIASSHDLLVSRDWRGVQIDDLTRSQFSHLDEQTRGRISISGDYVRINPRAAEAYGLALHELSINAVKHGALSRPSGAVELCFRVEQQGKIFVMTWRERGGPAVAAPPRAGFGSAVLTRMAPLSIQGESAVDYAPEGLTYRLSAPLAQIVMNG
jgi:PAS domain S-box-containing protein